MANDLTTSTTWTPPEAQAMSKFIKYGVFALLGIGAVYAFTVFAPTMVMALTLLNTILADGTLAVFYGIGFFASLFLLRETLSSNGSINKLARLPWHMFIMWTTKTLLTIDPLSPLTTRIASLQKDQQTFDAQAERLSGLVSSIHEKEDNCRAVVDKSTRQAIQAQKLGNTVVFQTASHMAGSNKDAADSYAKTRAKLEPVLATFQKISQTCNITIQQLDSDRKLLADQWAISKSVHDATDAASRILGQNKTQEWDMAQQAAEMIQNKYGEELGHLDHFKRYAEPMMESIDVQNATYDADMLAMIQDSGTKALTSASADKPVGLPLIPSPVSAGSADDFSGLLR